MRPEIPFAMLAVHHAFRQTSLSLSRSDGDWRCQQADQLRAIYEAVSARIAGLARRVTRAHVLANVARSAQKSSP